MPPLPTPLAPLIAALARNGIRTVLVGGYVRDTLLGLPCKDIDIECFGAASLDTLVPLLSPFGRVNLVGRSFGVIKLNVEGYDLDVSLPRTETKTGPGHRGFAVKMLETLDFKTAAKRRDFTVNAVGYDPAAQQLLDPYGGQNDLQSGILRCVDPDTFVEDPLRLLRAVQFAARFALTPDEALVRLAHTMMRSNALAELPRERIFEELKKLLLKSDAPSVGLRTMTQLNITPFFPELEALRTAGNWDTALRAVDAMARLRRRVAAEPLALMLAVLCLGMARPGAFLAAVTDDKRLTESVLAYVRYHREPERLYANGATDADIMRLAAQIRIDALTFVAEACHRGREPAAEQSDAAAWLRRNAERLGVLNAPRPALLGGSDLIKAGLTPSPLFKTLLDEAYDAQLAGAFRDKAGAKTWLDSYLSDLGKS